MAKRRRIVRTVAAPVVAAVTVAVGGPGDAQEPDGRGAGCAKAQSSTSGLHSAYVVKMLYDSFGCPVPVRRGIGHVPGRRGDFGWRHIVSRQVESPSKNHETTAFAQTLWQRALRGARAFRGLNYFCHSVRYTTTPGGQKRTMIVLVDYKDYQGWGVKGIITAYWAVGHTQC